MATKPDRRKARELLGAVLRTAGAFDAFCMDAFPVTYAKFVGGMNRQDRTNLLLEENDADIVVESLRRLHPREVASALGEPTVPATRRWPWIAAGAFTVVALISAAILAVTLATKDKPSPPPDCTFDGTASRVHVRGEGSAVFTLRAAFSAPLASRVELRGAWIADGPTRSVEVEVVDRPTDLTPVNDNPDDKAYDVTYLAGPPVVVTIKNGGQPGAFHGALAGVSCQGERNCDITWGANEKIIELHRAGREPVDLTSTFPHGAPDPNDPRALPSRVIDVELLGASGTLTCDGSAMRVAHALLTWSAGVRSVGPIQSRSDALGVIVRSNSRPEGLLDPALSLALRAGVGAAFVALLAVAAWRARGYLAPKLRR